MFISKKGWTLFNNADEKVVMDELLKTNDGELWIIEGGNPPHKPSSTGRVWVRPLGAEGMQREFFPSAEGMQREFFPTVFNLEWREDNDSN